MAHAASPPRSGATTDDVSASSATAEGQGAPAGPLAAPWRLAPRAANAATHGLTAGKYLPEILGKELLERHRQKFQFEWQPSTPTQACLVEELARHAAALERATPIEEAVLRTSARGLSSMSDTDADEDAGADRILAAACGSETVDRVTRYRRSHEKGFHTALARLRELRANAPTLLSPASPKLAIDVDEECCLRYLQQRADPRRYPCPACGSAQGTWLTGRRVWQCQGCRHQRSPRSGTVMHGSNLPARVWFAAIAALVADPEISTSDLCCVTGISREKTVRALAERIRRALGSSDAERLLAGLTASASATRHSAAEDRARN